MARSVRRIRKPETLYFGPKKKKKIPNPTPYRLRVEMCPLFFANHRTRFQRRIQIRLKLRLLTIAYTVNKLDRIELIRRNRIYKLYERFTLEIYLG